MLFRSHESARRKRKRLLIRRPVSETARCRAKQTKAGTAGTGGQRRCRKTPRRKTRGHPKLMGQKSPAAIRVRVAASDASDREERVLHLGCVEPTMFKPIGNDRQETSDPRNGLGKAKPTAVQSGNRQAAPFGRAAAKKNDRGEPSV